MNEPQTPPSIEFLIRHPGEQAQRILVESDRDMLGSGAHCEIRLPAEQAAAEHVLIRVHEGRVHAVARSWSPPPLLDQKAFKEAVVLPESVLKVGDVQIKISLLGGALDRPTAGRGSAPMRPGVFVLMMAFVFVAATLVFVRARRGQDVPTPVQIPELWADAARVCPQEEKSQALNLALDRKSAAEAKIERSPFDIRDAVDAVPLYELAAVCFARGGDVKGAAEARTAAADLRQQLEVQAHAHQTRLSYALEIKNGETAHREVDVLLAMYTGKEGPYLEWLASTERQLSIPASEKDKKKTKTP